MAPYREVADGRLRWVIEVRGYKVEGRTRRQVMVEVKRMDRAWVMAYRMLPQAIAASRRTTMRHALAGMDTMTKRIVQMAREQAAVKTESEGACD